MVDMVTGGSVCLCGWAYDGQGKDRRMMGIE